MSKRPISAVHGRCCGVTGDKYASYFRYRRSCFAFTFAIFVVKEYIKVGLSVTAKSNEIEQVVPIGQRRQTFSLSRVVTD